MKVRAAITRANALRPNTLSEEQKYAWLYELDGKLSEDMELEEVPENPFPADAELLMPYPCDNIYELYLVAMIDFYNQESALYQNDMGMFNAALSEAKAWWIRHNRPTLNHHWRTI
jgi:hypothetical protein